MSAFPLDHSFIKSMCERLLRFDAEFRVDNKLVPFEELLGSDTLLIELGAAFQVAIEDPRGNTARTYQVALKVEEANI